ncbi:hypothetical protein [uncultured Rhodospira sp.]|uniref:hypothetical protein n=1 Tax=uncultured Rhodospira sp. TaxID=1936189 RepID=UPI00260276B1|nr:hypothetical protein [uncultured Rhodospira sp.]
MNQTAEQTAAPRIPSASRMANVTLGNLLAVTDDRTMELQGLGPLCAMLARAADDDSIEKDQIQAAFTFIGTAVTVMARDMHDTLYLAQEEAMRHFDDQGVQWAGRRIAS